MSRILVLGGYGGFGARISRRLALAGHEVLVAGRSGETAARFCEADPQLIPLELDRSAIAGAIAEQRADLVVDASGPFQSMDHGVPRACIAARVPYADIADDRAFVCGIEALDAAAKEAGVAVISGASSVPALSGAVVRRLAEGMERVRAVDMAISASNRASAGPAVAGAMLGQAGQPFEMVRAGRRRRAYGWQGLGRQDFAIEGAAPLRGRRVALVNVPDLQSLPSRLPGRPAVRFRAGTEMTWQNLALWLGSWVVRAGLLGSLRPFARLAGPLHRLTARLGGERSGMVVRVFGDVDGQAVERRWTLIAEAGDGPEIPALSVPPLAEKILSGHEPAGARDAGQALALDDYEPAFEGLSVRHEVREYAAPTPLYARVMGADFGRLPDEVREMHAVWRDGGGEGEATVEAAANPLGALVARIMRFPPPGHHHLHVGFAEEDGVETWTRDFGGHRFSSQLSQDGDRLVEQFGILRFHFDLPADENGLEMVLRGWSAFGVPLPMALAPRSRAREWAEGGRFHFDVPIALPLLGRVVRYRGWLRPVR